MPDCASPLALPLWASEERCGFNPKRCTLRHKHSRVRRRTCTQSSSSSTARFASCLPGGMADLATRTAKHGISGIAEPERSSWGCRYWRNAVGVAGADFQAQDCTAAQTADGIYRG